MMFLFFWYLAWAYRSFALENGIRLALRNFRKIAKIRARSSFIAILQFIPHFPVLLRDPIQGIQTADA